VDLLCVPPAHRDAVADVVGSDSAGYRDYAARAVRSNRWWRPANALVHDPAYELQPATRSVRAHRGEALSLPVTIRNAGRQWLSDQFTRNPTLLSYRWVQDGAVLDGVGGPRVPFGSLRPGASREVLLRVVADREPGNYALDVGIVQEDLAWLVDLAPAVACPVEITIEREDVLCP
jgi:hypothetical protein